MGKVLFSFIMVIVIIIVTSGNRKSISVEEKTKISNDIHKHFYSDCIFLIHHAGLNDYLKISRFVKFINEEGMMNTVLDFSDISKFNEFERPICLGKKPLFIVPYVDDYMKELLSKFSEKMKISKFIWLVFLDKDILLEDFFTGINVTFDCEFLVAQPEDDHVVLTEVYRIRPTLPLQTYKFGNWSSIGGLASYQTGLYCRRDNLQGVTLITGARQSVTSSGGYDLNPSYFGAVWKILENVINFTSNYSTPEDNSSGARRSNGSWSGVMGMIQNGELDISNIPFVMTTERTTVVNFTFPLVSIRTYIIIKKPNLYSMKWNTFIAPLSWNLWLMIIFVVFFVSFCMAILYYSRIHMLHSKEEEFILTSSLFLVMGAFLLQGHHISSKSTSVRIIWITTYLTVVVLLASYSAALTTHLTMPKVWLPFYTFSDFVQDTTYRLGVMLNTAQSSYFENSKDVTLREIYRKRIASRLEDMPVDDVEGLKRVCGQYKYALATHTYNILNLDYIPNCTITVVTNAFIPGSIAIATPAGSPYREIFNHKIELLRSNGVLQREYKRYYRNVFEDHISPKLSVSFEDIVPVYCIMAYGIITSTIILILECNIYYFRKKYGHNTSTVLTVYLEDYLSGGIRLHPVLNVNNFQKN